MSSVERKQDTKQTIQVVPGDCRKPLGYGLQGEALSSQVISAHRHFNGAKAFQEAEKAYNGGASVVDRADRE